jgi:hypothetical protein|tara:strand:- start:139 stop:354 length:216 start_codon:yes stop_codon:yes gene_type:complete
VTGEVAFTGLFILALLAIGWKVKSYFDKAAKEAAKVRMEKKLEEIERAVNDLNRDALVAGVRGPRSGQNGS